jgi:predicted dehydrogenase
VNFEFCECDAWREVRADLQNDRIGPVSSVTVDWRVQTYANRNRLENWKSRPEDGGGTLQAFVAHTFHTLEIFAGPIYRLNARLSKAVDDPRPGETEVELEADFFLGGRATVHVATDAPPPHHHRIEIAGPTGLLTLLNVGTDYIAGFHVLYDPRGGPTMAENSSQSPAFGKKILRSATGLSWKEAASLTRDGRVEATSRLVQKFVDWALGGTAAQPNFHDGYRVQFLVDVARKSSTEGRWMDASL